MLQQLNFEHKILIVLYILSYFGAMLIQWKDPKVKVQPFDWFMGFLTSSIGAIITYFIAASWANMGFRMGFTIIASLMSYRIFKFILSNEAQDDFAKGFWKGIMSALGRLFNTNNNNINNNQNDK